jgi:hypothetical protein
MAMQTAGAATSTTTQTTPYPTAQVRLHANMQRMIALDTTGLNNLKDIANTLHKNSATLHLHLLQAQPLSLLQRSGFLKLLASFDAET